MMSNITKNFKAKAKRGLCMAQGGLLEQQVQQLQPAEPKQFGAAQFNTQDLMGMDRLTAGQYTNNPEILNSAMDAEGPKRYIDYSPAPRADSRLTPDALPAPVAKPQATQITAFADSGPSKLKTASLGGLRMAEGGMVPETAEQVMARMANKYGTTGAAQAAPVAQPAPVQAPQPVAQPKPAVGGLFGRALGGLRQANEQLRQVTNYAEGGIVRGKGGPTDDEVPMNIGGTDVNLSNKEAVLPAKTVDALGGPEAVEELIEETNGKPPVSKGLRQGGNYFTGTAGDMINPNELRPEFRSVAQTPVIEPAANPLQEGARNYRAVNAQAATAQPQGFYEKMGRQSAAETVKPPVTPAATPQAAGMASRALNYLGPVATGVGFATMAANAVDSFPSLRGRATAEASNMELAGTPQHDAEVNKALVAQDAAWEQRHGKTLSDAQRTNAQVPAVKQKPRFEDLPQASYSNEGRSVPTAGSNPVSTVDRTLVDNTLGKDAAIPQGLRGRWADNDPMNAQQFVSNDNATNGLRNNPANGHGVVSIKQKDGSFKNVLMGPSEYTAADGSKTSDWSKTSQFAQGTEQAAKEKASLRDMQYQNAKFNATSDQITDPSVQAAGLRGLAQYDKEETTKADVAKNKAAAENARIGHLLTEQGQRITLRGQDNMQRNNERDAAVAAEKDKREDAAKSAEQYFTMNDEKNNKVIDHDKLGLFNRWRSSFGQNDPRAKLEQSELYRRFMAEQVVKEMGAGGSKTELPINHKGTRSASLRDVLTMGNGVMLPFGQVEEFDNGAAIRSTSIPKNEYDTRRLLGLDK